LLRDPDLSSFLIPGVEWCEWGGSGDDVYLSAHDNPRGYLASMGFPCLSFLIFLTPPVPCYTPARCPRTRLLLALCRIQVSVLISPSFSSSDGHIATTVFDPNKIILDFVILALSAFFLLLMRISIWSKIFFVSLLPPSGLVCPPPDQWIRSQETGIATAKGPPFRFPFFAYCLEQSFLFAVPTPS